MKPVVIFVKEDEFANLSKNELKTLLQEAYEQGYSDGYNDGKKITITTPSNPVLPTVTPNYPYNPIVWCNAGDSTKSVITNGALITKTAENSSVKTVIN